VDLSGGGLGLPLRLQRGSQLDSGGLGGAALEGEQQGSTNGIHTHAGCWWGGSLSQRYLGGVTLGFAGEELRGVLQGDFFF